MGAAKGIKGLGRAATRPIGALGGGLLGGGRKKPGKGILGQVINSGALGGGVVGGMLGGGRPPKRGGKGGYGGRIGQGGMGTMDFIDKDRDGTDDRYQGGPGQPWQSSGKGGKRRPGVGISPGGRGPIRRPKQDFSQWDFASAGSADAQGKGALGLKDFESAIKQGARHSDLQAMRQAARKKGVKVGGKVDEYLMQNFGLGANEKWADKGVARGQIHQESGEEGAKILRKTDKRRYGANKAGFGKADWYHDLTEADPTLGTDSGSGDALRRMKYSPTLMRGLFQKAKDQGTQIGGWVKEEMRNYAKSKDPTNYRTNFRRDTGTTNFGYRGPGEKPADNPSGRYGDNTRPGKGWRHHGIK